jgi:hypothetical protein
MLLFVDRFGWDAAHNAPAAEMRRMMTIENIFKAFAERGKSVNWATWAQTHKAQARMLEQAMIAAQED